MLIKSCRRLPGDFFSGASLHFGWRVCFVYCCFSFSFSSVVGFCRLFVNDSMIDYTNELEATNRREGGRGPSGPFMIDLKPHSISKAPMLLWQWSINPTTAPMALSKMTASLPENSLLNKLETHLRTNHKLLKLLYEAELSLPIYPSPPLLCIIQMLHSGTS